MSTLLWFYNYRSYHAPQKDNEQDGDAPESNRTVYDLLGVRFHQGEFIWVLT